MRILELCANYPGRNEKSALSYVKARNHNYRESGVNDIIVLNFALREGYYIENDIRVISLVEYVTNYSDDDFSCYAAFLITTAKSCRRVAA